MWSYTVGMDLTPAQQARAFLEARIQILVDEAVATSALEGIRLDRTAVRRAVIRRLGLHATEDGDVRRIALARADEENIHIDLDGL